MAVEIPELSVIIPVYNRNGEANRAIASIIEQDFDCEVLIVDDASEKPIYTTVFDDQIQVRIIRHEESLHAAH